MVIVPALNESQVIQATLDNLGREIDYPKEYYEVIVIADNCTDDTAKIARAAGVKCLERNDNQHRGKGWALDWAFRQFLSQPYDAYLVVDADCRMDSHSLAAINCALESGQRVLQLNYKADNPDSSPISYAACVANYLENQFYHAPKSRLGLSVFLRGTGMAFHQSILKEIPWDASSIVEDLEYSLQLIRKRITTKYIVGAAVKSPFPESVQAFKVQRSRWTGGGAKITKSRFYDLLCESVRKQNALLVDAAISLWLQSRSAIVVYAVAMFTVCAVNWLIAASFFSSALFWLQVGVIGCMLTYGLIGVLGLGLTPRRLGFLFQIPVICANWLFISAKSWRESSASQQEWIRSPRAHEKQPSPKR